MRDGPRFGPYTCSNAVYVTARASAWVGGVLKQYCAPSAPGTLGPGDCSAVKNPYGG